MIQKSDIGKKVRLIKPSNKQLGKHFTLKQMDKLGWCIIEWNNSKQETVLVHKEDIELVPEENII